MASDTESEQWRSVAGYEGCYEVSDAGRVRSIRRPKTRGGVLKPLLHPGGYLRVTLWRNGRYENAFVHRLVAAAFLGRLPSPYQVAHGNGKKHDNRLANLRWASPAENQADRVLHGTAQTGKSRTKGHKQLTVREADRIRQMHASNPNVTAVARALGKPRTTVADVVRGRTFSTRCGLQS